MTKPQHFTELEEKGVCVVRDVIDAGTVKKLRVELESAVAEDIQARPNAFDRGMVHNCMFRGAEMAKLLENATMTAYLEELLLPSFILYAYQSSSLPPGTGNYGSRVHVDSPRFIPGYTTNIGVIFPLDEFSPETGGTEYMPGSHKRSELPKPQKFENGFETLCAKPGEMIIFNARLAHRAGTNKSATTRHALTMNFCRCYMRQRFDFARMLTPDLHKLFSEVGLRRLGWDVRTPTSLEEFYVPENQRLYKPNQE